MLRLSGVWLIACALCACANTSGNTTLKCVALSPTTTPVPIGFTGTIFTIVMENKNRTDIIGNLAAPFINELARQGTLAAGYHDSYVHPSEPNYLWMVAGENFGILDDGDPIVHSVASTSHLADQLEAAGLTWKSYQEGMGEPCGLVSHGRYAAKHDPFVYFNDVNGWDGSKFQYSQRCVDHVVDFSQLDADIANHAVPKYAFITPTLDHDMHDGSIAEGDRWLANEVPNILASDAYQQGGVLFVLWDEGSGTFAPGDEPPFIAIGANVKQGFVSHKRYDTSSFLKTVQKMTGVEALPCAKDPSETSAMDDLFTVAMQPDHEVHSHLATRSP